MKAKQIVFNLILLLLTSYEGVGQIPVANFTLNASTLCMGATYTITDLSSNAPTAWSYTIDDGFAPFTQPTITSVQNPTITFSLPLTYTITLVATNISGTSVPVSVVVNVKNSPLVMISPIAFTTCPGGLPTTLSVTNVSGMPSSGPYTYSWSSGSTGSLVTVSPNVSTIYTCVITNSTGCFDVQTASVTVSNASLSITSVPANICPGVTSTLTAIGSGLFPQTYTWSNNTNNTTFTSSVAGVFTASMTNAQGCSAISSYTLGTSTTLSLTAISKPEVVCAGGLAILEVTGAGTYTWSTGTISDTITVNPSSTTSYTVNGTIGACAGSVVITLSVNTSPTLVLSSTSNSLCQGQTATISAVGASSYTWQPGAIVASSIVVSPSVTTTYSLSGENPGCTEEMDTKQLQVFQKPVLTVSKSAATVCVGEAMTLSVSGASTYLWNTGFNASVYVIYPQTNSTYTVTGLSTNACKSIASVNVQVSACTSISESTMNKTSFTIYPNPSQSFVIVNLLYDVKLDVINQSGQLVFTASLEGGKEHKIITEGFIKGIYIVKISGKNTYQAEKLVIQ